MSDGPRFENPEFTGTADAEATIQRNHPEELLHVPVAVSLYAPDLDWAQSVCAQLAAHPDPRVRGNAVLGFGHLARRFRCLDRNIVMLIKAALHDPSQYVRGQAVTAADDIAHYLHWTIDTDD